MEAEFDEESIGLFPVSSEKKHKPIYLIPSDEFIICGKVIDVFKNVDSVHGSKYPVEYLE